jgi:hypothetical protein
VRSSHVDKSNPVSCQIVAGQAVAYADSVGNAELVSAAKPLPVTTYLPGHAFGRNRQCNDRHRPISPGIRPFGHPEPDGTWEGQVQLLRSPDNGVTRLPVTFGGAPWAIFGSNCCEPVWEERVVSRFTLDMIITSGSISYRISQ